MSQQQDEHDKRDKYPRFHTFAEKSIRNGRDGYGNHTNPEGFDNQRKNDTYQHTDISPNRHVGADQDEGNRDSHATCKLSPKWVCVS